MPRVRPLLCVAFVLLGAAAVLPAQNRLLLFPSGSSTVTVLDAATLNTLGTVTASPFAFQGLATPDGSKYYIVGTDGILTIVNASNLSARQVNLGVAVSAAVLTPNGKRLLVSAGRLRIFDTSTDQELVSGGLDVGSGPTAIEVNNDSSRAYVVCSGAALIAAVNLTNNTVAGQIPMRQPQSIALTPDGAKLLALKPDGLAVIDVVRNTVRGTIPVSNSGITSGTVLVTPDSSKAVVRIDGVAPFNLSQIVDLTSQELTPIGVNQGLDQLVITDNATAFGIVTGLGSVAKINLATGAAQIQTYGLNTRWISAAPNGKTVYLTSLQNKSVTRLDVASNLPTPPPVTVSLAPSRSSAVFPPPTTGAASAAVNGGDNQIVSTGQTAAIPLSVQVATSDGSPVFNYPVTFSTAADGVTITPNQPSTTNTRGIAEVFVSIAAAAAETAAGAPPVRQGLQSIVVTATAGAAGAVSFTLTFGAGTGIIIVSGDNQIAQPRTPFSLPMVVRVTDQNGNPVPQGTPVTFFPGNGAVCCAPQMTATNADGLAQAQFLGGVLPLGATVFPTSVVVSADDPSLQLGIASFSLQLSLLPPSLAGHFQGDGDQQTGNTGTTLPIPLRVQFGTGPAAGFNVHWQVLDGPSGVNSAALNPPVSFAVGSAQTQVTLGAQPGTIHVQASIPGVQATELFTLIAKGGPPAKVVALQGDNQQGAPATTLPLALRVRVLDPDGNGVPLPSPIYPLTFTVSPPNAATLSQLFQQANGEASVLVTLGSTFGAFTITATCGNGSVTFHLSATSKASAIVVLSGNNQSLAAGGDTATMVARVIDNIGSAAPGVPVTVSAPSTVTLTPAQGTAGNPISGVSDSTGKFSFTAKIGAGTTPGALNITASFAIPGGASGSVNFVVTVTSPTPPAPVFTTNGIVNAASFRAGMAPGSLATLFGSNLSGITGIEFPGGQTSYKGVTVTIAGRAAPLLSLGNANNQEQISFQVPFDVPTGTAHVDVTHNGQTGGADNVPVLLVQPGLFEYTPQGSSTKYSAALKTDGSVIGPTNPVARGDAAAIYVTGMGPLTPPVQTGQLGPASPLAVTSLQPQVGVAGNGATVLFSGYAPGFLGLYQINIVIPANTPPGPAVNLDIIVAGVAGQTSKLAVQ